MNNFRHKGQNKNKQSYQRTRLLIERKNSNNVIIIWQKPQSVFHG